MKTSETKFTQLPLSENILKGISDLSYEACTDVQAETFKHSLNGKDITVMSQTGTGKTAAFLITLFHFMEQRDKDSQKRALILSPTRELAIQIEKEAKALGKHLDLVIGSFYGGVGYNKQELLLKKKVDMIIGTPGRILDFIQSKKLSLKDFSFLIIDEADRLFDMGFYPDIEKIIRYMPPKTKRQTMMFSATLNAQARKIVREFMNKPEKVEISPEEITVKAISQVLYHVGSDEKIKLLLGILKFEMPKNVLIFTNLKNMAMIISKRLEHNGLHASYITGDLAQSKRLKAINDFKEGKLQILVATDVAARGIHVDDLEMVVNYDLPNDPESYVHRIGRTARAGKSGKAISFACEKFVYNLDAIEAYIESKIPAEFAEDHYFVSEKAGRINLNMESTKKRSADKRKKPSRSAPKKSKPKEIKKSAPAKHSPKPGVKTQDTKKGAPVSKKKSAQSQNRKKKSLKAMSQEERIGYYKKKYGEDFAIASQKTTKSSKSLPPKKGKLLKRVISFFKK